MEVHEVPFVGWFLWVLLCRRSNYLSNHLFCQPALILLDLAAGPCPPAKSRVDCCQLQPTSSHKSGHHGFAEVCNPPPRGVFPGPSACPRWHTVRTLRKAPVIVYVGESALLWWPEKCVPASLPKLWCQADAVWDTGGALPQKRSPALIPGFIVGPGFQVSPNHVFFFLPAGLWVP